MSVKTEELEIATSAGERMGAYLARPEGDAVLMRRGIEILPAILCNSGGVTVSYFEWVQNKSAVYWTACEVDERLNKHMVQAAHRVKTARKKYDVDMRTASYCAALEQIGKVYDLRGVFP